MTRSRADTCPGCGLVFLLRSMPRTCPGCGVFLNADSVPESQCASRHKAKPDRLTKANRRFICEPREIDLCLDPEGRVRHLTAGSHFKMVRKLSRMGLCSEILRYQAEEESPWSRCSEDERRKLIRRKPDWWILYQSGSGMIVELTPPAFQMYRQNQGLAESGDAPCPPAGSRGITVEIDGCDR